MADVTLKDGREITIDLYQISIKGYRTLFDPSSSEDESDKILAKTCGMDLKELQKLPYPDYRKIINAVLKRSREPLIDPNSPSASTED